MWSKQHKVWIQFRGDILATDKEEGQFLATHLRASAIARTYVGSLEIIDLQKYRLITRTVKVKIALRERMDTPFVFAVGKN
ncbi:MAG: hypothetical protein EOP51_01905 [Sphingobacteriales bacterium]|nr:MAG: hypothetical protein EOP51_01905 [Sphingobacteriales bacterium]